MEYVLMVTGIILIFISLYLTYRVDQDDDQYYIESELLSEIREVKTELETNLEVESQNFQQVLQTETKTQELTEIVDLISDLEQEVAKLDSKLDRLESRFSNLSSDQSTELKKDQEPKSEEYQKIKELVDQGFSLAEAAHELDMGNREVKLIWKLNSRREE